LQVREGDPDKAGHSLPPGFHLSPTSVAGSAGTGVFSDWDIPRGVVLGPYKGRTVSPDSDEALGSDYGWTVSPAVFWDSNDLRFDFVRP
jgi:hypothetical protein